MLQRFCGCAAVLCWITVSCDGLRAGLRGRTPHFALSRRWGVGVRGVSSFWNSGGSPCGPLGLTWRQKRKCRCL